MDPNFQRDIQVFIFFPETTGISWNLKLLIVCVFFSVFRSIGIWLIWCFFSFDVHLRNTWCLFVCLHDLLLGRFMAAIIPKRHPQGRRVSEGFPLGIAFLGFWGGELLGEKPTGQGLPGLGPPWLPLDVYPPGLENLSFKRPVEVNLYQVFFTSFFQVTFWSPEWRSLNPWKGHLNPQKGHLEEPGRCLSS